MTPTVSVIVPTYQGILRLGETVSAVLSQAGLHELIVVVDGSDDGSMELLQQLRAGDERLQPLLVENGGDNRARQIGLERASGDVVLFMDDDVVAGPGLLEGHAAHHGDGGGMVVIGYMPVAPPEPPRAGNFPRRLYAEWYEGQCRDYEERPAHILENLWNGNVSMTREDALRVGIPRPEYDTRYGPDRELGLRLQANGLRGVFDRRLRAEHRYVRTPEKFYADAASAGEGMWLCHRLYPDVLGPLTHEDFEQGLDAKRALAVRLSRRPGLHRALDAALSVAVTAAGAAGQWHAQEQAAALKARVLQQEAAVRRSATPVSGAPPQN